MEEMKKEILQDQEPETSSSKQAWRCDIYCRKVRHVKCEGQEHVDQNAPDPCPYMDEMLY